MRGANILVIMLVVGMLLFGCTGPNPPAKPAGNGTSPPTGGETSPPTDTGTSGSTGTETGAETGTETGSTGSETGSTGSTGTETGTTGSTGDDLAGKTYEALVALGVPLQCDITTTSEGKSINVKVYMKGSDEVRSEAVVEGSEACSQMVSIMKGKTFYMGCADGSIMQDCAWLQMTLNESAAASPTTGTASAPDYTEVPPADIRCVPWVYDASKFVVSGKVCNLDDLMKGYGNYNIPDN